MSDAGRPEAPPAAAEPTTTSRGSTASQPAASRGGPSLIVCLLLGLFAGSLSLLFPQKAFDALDWKLFDLRLRWRNTLLPHPISDKVLVIGIDERDKYIYGALEYSRGMHADLVSALRRHGVGAVVFDIMFILERPFDDLFAAHLRDVPSFLAVGFLSIPFDRMPAAAPPEDLDETIRDARTVRDSDDAWHKVALLRDYAETLEDTRRRLAADRTDSAEALREVAIRSAWVRYLIDRYLEVYYAARFGRPFDEALDGSPFEAADIQLPSAPLLRSATGAGFINVGRTGEEIVRRIPLVYEYENRLYPALDLLVVLHHYGATFEECRIEFGRSVEFPIRRRGSGIKRIPIDRRGEYLVNFRQGEDFILRTANRTLSFYTHPQYEAEREKVDLDELLQDAIVLVGDVAQGSSDIHPIPLQPLFPLVGVHANVIDNILKDDYLRQTPRWVEALLVLALGVGLGLVFARNPSGRATRIAIGALAVYLLGQFLLFLYGDNLILPIGRMVATSISGYVFLALYTVGVIERDRRLVKEVFLKSVSPRIGEEILRRFNDPSLWASRRVISVLFVDIRGFTSLSERLEPDKLVELLDVYYDTVSEVVFRHDGQVNKFIGDAVMALFGALPGESPNHAERSVRAALDIHRAVGALEGPHRDSPAAEGDPRPPLRIGVGVNTGEVVVGTVGRRKIRIEYTALGDTVNTAERLQGQAGAGKVYIGGKTVEALRSESDPAFLRTLRFERVEGLTLKGKTHNVEVYECRFAIEDAPFSPEGSLRPSRTIAS